MLIIVSEIIVIILTRELPYVHKKSPDMQKLHR